MGPHLALAQQGTLMIIQAARRFACAHRYVVTAAGEQWLFVCETCEHRAEQLPLTRHTTVGQVLTFRSPWAGDEFGATERSNRHPDASLVQSA
jgi:hypothetical protein